MKKIQTFSRIALLAVVAGAVFVGCDRAPRDPFHARARLRNQIESQPPFQFGWNCTVQDELRPALGCAQLTQLLHDVRPFPESGGTVQVRTRVPAKMIGHPLIVRLALVAKRAESWQEVETRFYPAAPAQLELDFPLEGVTTDKHGELRLLAEGFRVFPPELQWVSAEIEVPAEARFTTGLALQEIDAGTAKAGASFRIRVVGDGVDETLHESSIAATATPGWQEISVDLTGMAGKRLRFIFESWRQGEGVAYPLFGAPLVLARGPRGKARNVILVSLDTLRGDHVERSRDEIPLMPELSAWARGGSLFESAFSAYPSTSAGHMTIFTSTWPVEHRVTFANQIAPRWISTLTETFANSGYETGAVTENAMLAAHSGFSRGFDTYKENRGIGKWESAGEAEKTIAQGIEWLEHHTDDVFFLFLHTYEVHAPYAPPEDVRFPVDPTAPRAEKQMVRYQGEARHMDRILAGLFKTLERLDLDENTIVAITSDHGEAFGEHGHIGHSKTVYDEFVHVPLIFRAPGIVKPGLRFKEQVSLIDVAPTLLDLAGLSAPPTMRGRSLGPALRGETAPRPEEFIFFEAPIGWERAKGRIFAARSEKYKFIGREKMDEVAEIYDLAADPGEKNNLATDPELQKVAREVIGRYKELDRQTKRREAGLPVAPPAAKKTLDSDMQEKLKALGYVD